MRRLERQSKIKCTVGIVEKNEDEGKDEDQKKEDDKEDAVAGDKEDGKESQSEGEKDLKENKIEKTENATNIDA